MKVVLVHFFSVVLMISVMTGCNNFAEDEMLDSMVSSHPDFYMLYAVTDKNKNFDSFDEVQAYYNVDFNQYLSKASLDTLLYGSYIWLYSGYKYEYIETLEFGEFPAFVVFDSEQLVFKSSNIEEVEEFLSTRQETPGIKLRKEQEIDYHGL